MSLKYKSPLIKSRNTSAASNDASPNVEKHPQLADKKLMDNKLSNILVYDNYPQHSSPITQHWRGRGSSSPRFSGPRFTGSPRFSGPCPSGSPYQWTPPNRMNNSWNSNPNSSGRYTSQEQNSYSSPRPEFKKYKKQNLNNYSNQYSNENNNESYFHPSMLEDPWETLLNSSENNI
ncbi:gastrula-specific protein 17-like [Sipha flava]|uniref:Gastrula-specific protein 17-like n=1 Tax=Sipha flava TaxID=143950 RepID=A0A8B8G8A5_9HEMI|nr:gastrula-specific protein 17-like [Sipha flava]